MLLRRFRWSDSAEPVTSANVTVLTGAREPRHRDPAPPGTGATDVWTIRSDDGITHGAMGSRAEAVRTMSLLALRGVPLPLQVLDPDGELTGDRLA